MGIQLEVGKTYVDRKGRVYGPLVKTGTSFGETHGDCGWGEDGHRVSSIEPRESDLVTEFNGIAPSEREQISNELSEWSKKLVAHDAVQRERYEETAKFIGALRDSVDNQVVNLEAKIANLLSRVEKLEERKPAQPVTWTAPEPWRPDPGEGYELVDLRLNAYPNHNKLEIWSYGKWVPLDKSVYGVRHGDFIRIRKNSEPVT